jgi:hypothetical protein
VNYLALLLITIALGLASRWWAGALPRFVGAYVGDALWACAVYWAIALVRPRAGRVNRGLLALCFAIAVEVSQLFHPTWLDGIRRTPLGGLLLGFGFLWSDLACYAAGIALAIGIDRLLAGKGLLETRRDRPRDEELKPTGIRSSLVE